MIVYPVFTGSLQSQLWLLRNIDPLPVVQCLISVCFGCRIEEKDSPTGSWNRSDCYTTSMEGLHDLR